MKIVAGIGLLFLAYCLLQILAKWNKRTGIEKGIWFVLLVVAGHWCVSTLLE
jgi:hypothetical protein